MAKQGRTPYNPSRLTATSIIAVLFSQILKAWSYDAGKDLQTGELLSGETMSQVKHDPLVYRWSVDNLSGASLKRIQQLVALYLWNANHGLAFLVNCEPYKYSTAQVAAFFDKAYPPIGGVASKNVKSALDGVLDLMGIGLQ